MRDEFPPDVKRTLAGRAGHKCSVWYKSTSGPAGDSPVALSDGIAAHITAASRKGPRFDASLSQEQRRSAKNGIWACTQHGREIDADKSAFSADVLRGLKSIREDAAARELQAGSEIVDQSAKLVEFPFVTTTYKLFELIEGQSYVFGTITSLRDLLRAGEEPSRVVDLTAEVVAEVWSEHPNVAGILATLLSNNLDLWQPSDKLIVELRQLCESVIDADDWTRVAQVEPLAFALGAKGAADVHAKLLERLITNRKWRKADVNRVRAYYGTVGNEIASIVRHWRDPFRQGLLRANDVARLMDLLLSADVTFSPPAGPALLKLLAQHAQVLAKHGQEDSAHKVVELLDALKLKRPANQAVRSTSRIHRRIKAKGPRRAAR